MPGGTGELGIPLPVELRVCLVARARAGPSFPGVWFSFWEQCGSREPRQRRRWQLLRVVPAVLSVKTREGKLPLAPGVAASLTALPVPVSCHLLSLSHPGGEREPELQVCQDNLGVHQSQEIREH